MLFTSPSFLFAFMPLVLLAHALAGRSLRNLLLLAASLLFYFTFSGPLTLVLLLSILVNWALARHLPRVHGARRARALAAGILANLLPLLYFKYARFILAVLGFPDALPEAATPLPIGISFFTFQAISYLADIAARRIPPARSLIDFGMYHACFPQLVAGPIVRYEEIAGEVKFRRLSLQDAQNGAVQFCFGLGRKAILADPAGRIADTVFALPHGASNFATAWIGIAAYTMQIYFDFSGYSDMAIGLGRMLGFHYPRNFDQPYRARSVTEFWRRWHMTLSRWFRDYVYIPLGGNRGGLARTLFNLLLVFFLCGLWHGAAYSFIVWGLLHGAVLMLERLARGMTAWRPPAWLGWAATLIFVMLAWVFFRAATLQQALWYLADLLSPSRQPPAPALQSILTGKAICLLALAFGLALIPPKRGTGFGPLLSAASLAVAMLAIVMVSANGFSPFIYFRF
jgi:alginate O-acetyltransferase complex protein AlgI